MPATLRPMKEELNEEPKAEQEGSGRTMLVARRLGVTGGCGMQKEGHTLAFWFGEPRFSTTSPFGSKTA